MDVFSLTDIEKILFLDIETVPQYPLFDAMPLAQQRLWDKKAKNLTKDEQNGSEIYARAGIYAEFGKIICISTGFITQGQLRIKSFYGHNEADILQPFNQMVQRHFNSSMHYLCAHNGKEFDFPYIARRTIINSLALASVLDTRGQKPWDVRHIDTLELWRFGDYKNYTSLELLSYIFDIPTPKDDITGDQVSDVYWNEHNLDRIVEYCQKDVVALTQLYLRFRGLPLIEQQNISIV